MNKEDLEQYYYDYDEYCEECGKGLSEFEAKKFGGLCADCALRDKKKIKRKKVYYGNN